MSDVGEPSTKWLIAFDHGDDAIEVFHGLPLVEISGRVRNLASSAGASTGSMYLEGALVRRLDMQTISKLRLDLVIPSSPHWDTVDFRLQLPLFGYECGEYDLRVQLMDDSNSPQLNCVEALTFVRLSTGPAAKDAAYQLLENYPTFVLSSLEEHPLPNLLDIPSGAAGNFVIRPEIYNQFEESETRQSQRTRYNAQKGNESGRDVVQKFSSVPYKFPKISVGYLPEASIMGKKSFVSTAHGFFVDSIGPGGDLRRQAGRINSFNFSPIKETLSKTYENIGVFAHGGYENYGHWHVDCLASLCLLQSLSDLKIIPDLQICLPPLKTWQNVCLSILGVDTSNFIAVDGYVLRARNLYFPSFFASAGSFMDPYCVSIFKKIISRLRSQRDMPPGPQNIYISRTGYKLRQMVNEEQLVAALEKLGFYIFYATEHSYESQVLTFRDARLIIGPHGAGLTNMAFAHPECVIVDLFSAGWQHAFFFQMANVLGMSYYAYISQEPFNREDWRISEWSINVDDLVSVIENSFLLESI